ncbi:hypothetical protein EFO67_06315 [Limosilactobacillus reuteri]|nr:hypothetical protein [Limosilactobacillus reuteri]
MGGVQASTLTAGKDNTTLPSDSGKASANNAQQVLGEDAKANSQVSGTSSSTVVTDKAQSVTNKDNANKTQSIPDSGDFHSSNVTEYHQGMFAGKNINFIVDNDADGQKLVDVNTNGEKLNSWLFSDANHMTPSGSITTRYMPLMKLITDNRRIQKGQLPVANKIAYERDIHYTAPNNYSFDNGDSIYIVMQKAIFNKYYQRIQVNNANRKIKKYADEGMWTFDKDSSTGATEKDGNVSLDESLAPTFEGYTNIVTINNQGTSLTPSRAKEVPSAKIDLDASELSSTVDVTYKTNKEFF